MTTYEDIKHENPLIRDVQKRLWKLNDNWLSIITGDTGSGKSWTALSLAEKIDPDFNTGELPTTFKIPGFDTVCQGQPTVNYPLP